MLPSTVSLREVYVMKRGTHQCATISCLQVACMSAKCFLPGDRQITMCQLAVMEEFGGSNIWHMHVENSANSANLVNNSAHSANSVNLTSSASSVNLKVLPERRQVQRQRQAMNPACHTDEGSDGGKGKVGISSLCGMSWVMLLSRWWQCRTRLTVTCITVCTRAFQIFSKIYLHLFALLLTCQNCHAFGSSTLGCRISNN